MAAAAVSEPVSAPGQAQLEAVKGMLQSQLPFLDGQVDTLLRTAYELQDGLSRSAGHARKPLPSLEQVAAVVDWLKAGMEGGHPRGPATVLMRCADLLAADLDAQLRPARDFLLFAGFSTGQVASTMYNLPAVLLRDVTRDLLPTYEYLRSLGLADDNLTGILRTCPKLMMLPLKAELRTNVALLVGSGLVGADLGRVISLAPSALSTRSSVLMQRLSFVREELGGSMQDVVAVPQLLDTNLPRLQHRLATLAARGRRVELPSQVAAAEASAAPAVPRMPITARGLGARSPAYHIKDLMKPSAEPVPLSFLITAKKMRWTRFCREALTPEAANEAGTAGAPAGSAALPDGGTAEASAAGASATDGSAVSRAPGGQGGIGTDLKVAIRSAHDVSA